MKELVSAYEVENLRKEIERMLDKVDNQRNSVFELIQKIMKMTVKSVELSNTGIGQFNTVKINLRIPVDLKFDIPELDFDISQHDRDRLKLGLDTLEKMSQTIDNMMTNLNMWLEETGKYDLSALNECQVKTLEKFGDKLLDVEKYLDLRITDTGGLENSELFRKSNQYFPV